MGASGKSFGAITAKDIETALKNLGYTVDRRQIRLPEQIKSVGLHTAEVKLHSEVTVTVQVKVLAAQVAAPAEGAAKGKGKKGAKKKSDDAEGAEGSADAAVEASESNESAE